jgi:hypothetical protein
MREMKLWEIFILKSRLTFLKGILIIMMLLLIASFLEVYLVIVGNRLSINPIAPR